MKVYDLRKRCHNKAEGNDFYELDKRIMRAGASLQEFGKRLGRDR